LNTDQPSKLGILVAVGIAVLVGMCVGAGEGICCVVVARICGVGGAAQAARRIISSRNKVLKWICLIMFFASLLINVLTQIMKREKAERAW
jgi:hypothetical protein